MPALPAATPRQMAHRIKAMDGFWMLVWRFADAFRPRWRAIEQRCSASRRRSVRHAAVAPDIDARSGERAVRLLGGGNDTEPGAGFEIGLTAHLVAHNRRIGPNHDLFLTVLVFDQNGGPLHRANDIADRAVGHGRVGRAVPRPVSVALPPHRRRENVHFERL